MPVFNIVDKRSNKYKWAKITVIVEPTVHDNSCTDADQIVLGSLRDYPGVGYAEHESISLLEAINQWHKVPYAVTLFLYDLGGGISESKPKDN